MSVIPYQQFLGGRDPLTVLACTPAKLFDLSAGLDPDRLAKRPAADKWSIHEIVAHLADCELMFGARCRLIAFEDHPQLTPFDQNRFAHGWRREEEPFDATLERFRVLREADLRLFRACGPADLERTGFHPEHGERKLGDLPIMMAGHDLNHIPQIERIRQDLLK